MTHKIRKRRDVSSSIEDGVIMIEQKAVVEVSFESTGNSTINWSEETQTELKNDIETSTNKEGIKVDGIG